MSKRELERLKREVEELTRPKNSRGNTALEAGRGREAEQRTQIPPAGWKEILLRAWSEVSEANLFPRGVDLGA